MKFILKISPFLLSIIMLLSLFLNRLFNPYISYFEEYSFLPVLNILSSLVIFLWFIGLADFVYHETNKKNLKWYLFSISCLSVNFLLDFLQVFRSFSLQQFVLIYLNIFSVKALIVASIVTKFLLYISLITLIRKYLYARSVWMIFFELAIPFLGVFSLNNALLSEKKELELIEQDLNQFGKGR